MVHRLLPTLLPAATAVLALPLHGQIPAPAIPVAEGQGMWTGDALGLQFRQDPATTRLGVRNAGVGGQTATWSAQRFGAPSIDHPDYSPQALFAHWVPALFAQSASQWNPSDPLHTPTLGGWSTGGDIVPAVDSAGVLQLLPPATPAWYNLSFTVDDAAVGVANSAVAQAVAATGRASDHVFSYTALGSSLIRPDHVHTVRTEYVGSQVGLQGAAPALTAIDWGMGLISETPGGTPSRLQPVRDRLYFSLESAWVAQTAFPIPGGAAPQSNVIYGMEWDGASWSVPTVAFDEQALFGSPQPGAELDAISVWAGNGTFGQEPTAVFSLTPASTLDVGGTVTEPDQILVSQRGAFHPTSSVDVFAATLSIQTDSAAAPVSTAGGLEKGGATGTVPDNVTGLCGRDPSEGQTLDRYKGTPTEEAEKSLGVELAALRHFVVPTKADAAGNQDTLRLTVSGVDEAGYDLVVVDFELTTMHLVGGVLEPKTGYPLLTTHGGAGAGLVEGVYPFTLPVGFAEELRITATVHGVQLSSLTVTPNIAEAGSISLGLH
jgi:hypothetical protein